MALAYVCPSVISWFYIDTAEWVELVFDVEAILGLSYTVFKGMWVSPRIRVLHSGALSQTLDLKISLKHIDHHKHCQLSSTDDRR